MFGSSHQHMTLAIVVVLVAFGPITVLQATGYWQIDNSVDNNSCDPDVNVQLGPPEYQDTGLSKVFHVYDHTGTHGELFEGTAAAELAGSCSFQSYLGVSAQNGGAINDSHWGSCGGGAEVQYVWHPDGDPSPGIVLDWEVDASGSVSIQGRTDSQDPYASCTGFGYASAGGWPAGAGTSGDTTWATGSDTTSGTATGDCDGIHSSILLQTHGYDGGGSWTLQGTGSYTSAAGVTSVWAGGGAGCDSYASALADSSPRPQQTTWARVDVWVNAEGLYDVTGSSR